MNYEQIHIPVLLKETLDILGIKGDGIYVDATVGPGGHSAEILMRIDSGRLVGIDRDQDVLAYARERFGNDRVHLEKGCLSRLKEVLLSLNIREVDGVLFDLGVSMTQLKELKRGFSFLSETRLDMRMDTAQKLTAWDVVNRYPEKDIERVLREYGEEPFARRLAKAIVTHRRKHSSINTCAELANFVAGVYGRRGKRHPATRTFQAVRIEVNNEIDELAKGLASALDMLKVGGRLCVISYHSLEDRMVKNFMRDGGREGLLRVLTKKPVAPAYDEIRKNPSSRSAKLRGGEKI